MKIVVYYNNGVNSNFEIDVEDFENWVREITKKKVWFIQGKNNSIAIMIDKINFIEEVKK